MKMRTTVRVTLSAVLAVLVAAGSIAAGQQAKPLPPPPEGFKALPTGPSAAAMKDAGLGDTVAAEKANANWPNCFADPKIGFSYGWTAAPGGGQIVEMMAQAPEDPAKEGGGSRDEPLGKQRYKGGVLSWRRKTMTSVGTSAACTETVTLDGQWMGYVSEKLISVSVVNLYGPNSKDTGQAWIDQYVDKTIAPLSR